MEEAETYSCSTEIRPYKEHVGQGPAEPRSRAAAGYHHPEVSKALLKDWI